MPELVMLYLKLSEFNFPLVSSTGFESTTAVAIPVEEWEIFLPVKKMNISLIDSLIRTKIYKKKMQCAPDKKLGMMNDWGISVMVLGNICLKTK